LEAALWAGSSRVGREGRDYIAKGRCTFFGHHPKQGAGGNQKYGMQRCKKEASVRAAQ
jgi:hypothetical protein